jgi:hypothetical protein
VNSVDGAISRVRRDITLGTALRMLMLGAAGASIVLGPFIGGFFNGTFFLILIAAVWLFLSYRSVKGSRLAADSPALIASGRYDEAEEQIQSALKSFSLFKTVKILSLHHLAVLRHAQKRWDDSAALCRAILGERLGAMRGLSKPSRLILADALLEKGDVNGAYDALSGLYSERLNLGEALNLMLVQQDYLASVGAWEQMFAGIETKVQLAELLPTNQAAKAQAFLALAAKKIGRIDWAEWLKTRVELLIDVQQLTTERPILWELWEKNSVNRTED